MVVLVRKIVEACDSTVQGQKIYEVISSDLFAGRDVTLDFAGVHGMTSSFLNSAFIPLLDKVPFSAVKAHMHVRNANRQVSNMLRDRMTVHAERISAIA